MRRRGVGVCSWLCPRWFHFTDSRTARPAAARFASRISEYLREKMTPWAPALSAAADDLTKSRRVMAACIFTSINPCASKFNGNCFVIENGQDCTMLLEFSLSSIGWRRGLGRGGAFLLVSPFLSWFDAFSLG